MSAGPRMPSALASPHHRAPSARPTTSRASSSIIGVSIGIAIAPGDGNERRPAPEERRPCALPRQGRRPRHLSLLRAARWTRACRRAARSNSICARRSASGQLAALLPAAGQRQDRRGALLRSAVALVPSAAGRGAAGGVHAARRGNRADRAARRMGPARRLRRSGQMAVASSASPSICRRSSSRTGIW